ncbi:MAG: Na/Pi symporter [Treponema sp.]|nr:Na/Pi symporter [Treponema sp.]
MDRIYDFLSLFIGVGIFLVGTTMLSEGLGRNASRSKSALFKKIGDNRIVGYGIGALVTAIIQASAATIITVVGLVNAGILTVLQASAIILGAHIGTTSTLFLVSLSFFDIKYLFMIMGFVGILMKIFSKKEKTIGIANILISFGVLFVGLNLMSNALRNNIELREFFIYIFGVLENPLLLILAGFLFTLLLQSSTASTSLFLMMIGEGLLSFEYAMFLSMGAIIGTSFTPMIAALPAKTRAKQAALLNILFSLIGTAGFTCIAWPFSRNIAYFFENHIPLTWRYPVFLFSYHLIVALILIWFLKPLSRLVTIILKQKPKKEKKKAQTTVYINDLLLETPSLAVEQTKKEILYMMDKTKANLSGAFNALINQDLKKRKKIKKEENLIDSLNSAISKFIVMLSGCDITEKEKILLGHYGYIANDIERVGDNAYNLAKAANRMRKNDYKFSKKPASQLQELYDKVFNLFDVCVEIFEKGDLKKHKEIKTIRDEIDLLKSKMTMGQIMWFKAGQYISAGGQYFYSAVSELKSMADHLGNIAQSATSIYDRRAYDRDEAEIEAEGDVEEAEEAEETEEDVDLIEIPKET